MEPVIELSSGADIPRRFDARWFRRSVKQHSVLRHPYLMAAWERILSREDLKLFALQESFVSLSFPTMMAQIVARIPYALELIRYPLITNMFEEVGERDPAQSHPALLRNLATALGASEEQVFSAVPLPTTKSYLDALFRICSDDSYAAGLGAIGYGNEYLVLFEYPAFRIAAAACSCSSDVLKFFDVNIAADASHTVAMERAVAAAVAEGICVSDVYRGMLAALDARAVFYDGLWERFSAGRQSDIPQAKD